MRVFAGRIGSMLPFMGVGLHDEAKISNWQTNRSEGARPDSLSWLHVREDDGKRKTFL